jgi:hypothetical protein
MHIHDFQLRTLTFKVEDAAHTYVDYIVAQGVVEKVVFAYGFHNDIAARDVAFALIQNGAGFNIGNTQLALAAGANSYLYEAIKMPAPLVLRYLDTIRFSIPLLGAGKTATIVLSVLRMLGEDTYGF